MERRQENVMGGEREVVKRLGSEKRVEQGRKGGFYI